MSSASQRAEYIRRHYSLRHEAGVWVARMGEICAISSNDRTLVIAEARRRWGHFNFQDEIRAFSEIFPAHESARVAQLDAARERARKPYDTEPA